MFDVDPSLLEAPYHQEVVVNGEVRSVAALAERWGGISLASQEQPRLVLYIRASCPYCQKVMAYLRNTYGTIPQSIQIKDIGKDPQFIPELIQVGGKRQVPCLVIDGEALYESKDIIQWFSESLK